MRRELDYIEDDAGAVRWALGCVLASYRARLTHRPWFSARTAWRQVAASGALMLVIGFALLDNAGGQTVPPRPAVDETRCDLPSASLQAGTRLRCDVSQHCGANAAADLADHPVQTRRSDGACPVPPERSDFP
jgi:hypothetical protein